jgi:hypothetical protein
MTQQECIGMNVNSHTQSKALVHPRVGCGALAQRSATTAFNESQFKWPAVWRDKGWWGYGWVGRGQEQKRARTPKPLTFIHFPFFK